MHECEERNARGVGAQRPETHADGLKAVGLKKVHLEVVPTALRADGKQDSFFHALPHDPACQPRCRRIGHETKAALEQAVELVLDEHLESSVDGDRRQSRVARLLQSFDQQRPVALGREDVRVEVVSFHALRVGQDDLTDSKRSDLCPEASEHFRSGKCKEHVDPRQGRNGRFKRAPQFDRVGRNGLYRGHSARATQDTDTHLMPRRDPQDVLQVGGSDAGETDITSTSDFAGLEKDQIHTSCKLGKRRCQNDCRYSLENCCTRVSSASDNGGRSAVPANDAASVRASRPSRL
jgi:hypothetical protein